MKNVTHFKRPAIEDLEWVGGRVLSPFYITEGTPYRPEMTFWVEMPEGAVVSFSIGTEENEAGAFGESLAAAMETPMYGAPRRPSVVRVADSELAAEVRRVLPGVRIVLAPTPEVASVMEAMHSATRPELESGGGASEELSYFEGGRVGVAAVERLFRAADALYRAAPWKSAADSQFLRVDIPAHGVEGACLSIIGALGQSLGIILFPSLEGYERFAALNDREEPLDESLDGPIDLGTSMLSLTFHAGAELPDGMYRETLEHRWPVSNARAYPTVEHRDPDAVPRPLVERDFEIMTACAQSLAAFYRKHRKRFELDSFNEPIRETYNAVGGVDVRLTAPFEEGPAYEFEPIAATTTSTPISTAKQGRNEPCPCGSGKKYKNCCLKRAVAELAARDPAAGARVPPTESHSLDARLHRQLARYADQRFGYAWIDLADEAFLDPPKPETLWGHWAFYHQILEGETIARSYLETYDDRLTGVDRAWLEAQLAAWLSIWEIVETEPGRSLTLLDLLTGETRLVQEKNASKSAVKRDCLLARVIDFQGYSVLCGMYNRALPPRDAAAVVERTRDRLRRKRAVPVDRLRAEPIGLRMIESWEDALEEIEMRASIPPNLQNTDGHPLLVTEDHFAFDPVARSEIQRRLADLKEVEDPPDADDPEQVFVLTKPGNQVHKRWTNTVIAKATISGDMLRVETNSVERSDALRTLVEASLGSLIVHRARVHADPISSMNRMRGAKAHPAGPPGTSLPPSEELDRVMLELKAQHYADWVDESIPLPGGMTPRAAVQTKSGRKAVELLLKESENRESRLPGGQRFDFGAIRRELGLDG